VAAAASTAPGGYYYGVSATGNPNPVTTTGPFPTAAAAQAAADAEQAEYTPGQGNYQVLTAAQILPQ